MVVIAGYTQTPEVISVSSMNTLGGGGVATIMIYDFEQANKASYKSDVGKTITFTEERSGWNIIVFKGEHMLVEQMGEHQLKLTVDGGGRKTFKQPTNHNQILDSGIVQYVHDDDLEDLENLPFDYGESVGKALVFKKFDLKSSTLHPVSIVTKPASPVTQAGGLNTLMFDNGVYTGALGNGNEYSMMDNTNPGGEYDNMILTYHMYKKNGLSVNEITLENLFTVYTADGPLGTTGTLASIELLIYNYQTTTYDRILFSDFIDIAWSDTDINNPPFRTSIKISQVGTLTDYMDAVGGLNSSDFQKYELKIKVMGALTVTTVSQYIRLFYQHLYFQFNGNQTPGLSQGYITTAITRKLTMDNTKAWALDDFPIADGYTKGDAWYIVKWLDDMWVDIFSDSPITFTLDQDVTDFDIGADVSEIYNLMIGDALNKYTNKYNAIWWYEPSNDKIYLRSLDNVLKTYYNAGANRTEISQADVIGGDSGVTHTISGRNLRDYLRFTGSYDQVDSSDLTPEATLTQGDTYAIETDSSIVSTYLLNQAVAFRQFKFTKLKEDIRVPVDLSKTDQWENLTIGKWIDIKVGGTTGKIVNFVFGVTEPVLVYGLGLRYDKATGFKDDIDLILQRRNNS